MVIIIIGEFVIIRRGGINRIIIVFKEESSRKVNRISGFFGGVEAAVKG